MMIQKFSETVDVSEHMRNGITDATFRIIASIDELEHLWMCLGYCHEQNVFTLPREQEKNKELCNEIVKALGFGPEYNLK